MTDIADMALDEIIAQKRTNNRNRSRRPTGGRPAAGGRSAAGRPSPSAAPSAPAPLMRNVAANAKKLVVSNLAPTVTENDVRVLFGKIGVVSTSQLNYNSAGKSKGVATVIYKFPGHAAKAFDEYNNRTFDDRPMRIELVVNPEARAVNLGPATGTSSAPSQRGASGAVVKTRAPARGRNGGGRRPAKSPKKPVTQADLDAEMDAYMNDSNASAAAEATSGQLANALA